MDNGNATTSVSEHQQQPAQDSPDGKQPSGRRWPIPRQLLYVLAGLGVVAVLVYLFRPKPIAVDLGEVKRGALQVTVDSEGKTRVRDRYVVAAPVDGRLLRVDLEEGDTIEPNALVARIDPLPYTTQVQEAQARLEELQAQLVGVDTRRPKPAALARARSQIEVAQAARQEAQARVARAEAALAQARRDRQRAEFLQAQGAIPQQDLESAQLEETTRERELDVARRELEAAIADVNAAREELNRLQAERSDPDYLLEVYRSQMEAVRAELANLTDEAQRTTIDAPAGGQVLRVMQKSSRYVTAGTPILEVGNANRLELVIDILSTDAVRVKSGNPIQIEHWGGDGTLNAEVRYVEPSAFTEVSALGVEEQRVNVIGDFTDSSVPLGDGYRVEAQIVVWQDDDVLKVPVSALFRCEQSWCAFAVEEGRVQQRQIAIGQRSDFEAVVRDGLQQGETVILHPTEQIEDGKRVKAR